MTWNTQWLGIASVSLVLAVADASVAAFPPVPGDRVITAPLSTGYAGTRLSADRGPFVCLNCEQTDQPPPGSAPAPDSGMIWTYLGDNCDELPNQSGYSYCSDCTDDSTSGYTCNVVEVWLDGWWFYGTCEDNQCRENGRNLADARAALLNGDLPRLAVILADGAENIWLNPERRALQGRRCGSQVALSLSMAQKVFEELQRQVATARRSRS